MPSNFEIATRLARDLRKRLTNAESILWRELRGRRICGKKFLRQHPLFFDYYGSQVFFISDFYCHEARLVVEIDGKSHDFQKEYDEYRTYLINTRGIHVVQFKNEDVEKKTDEVLQELERLVNV